MAGWGENGPVPTSLTRPTANAEQTRDALTGLRPDLVEDYDRALPGARATVLSRLLGALDREPLPTLTGRSRQNGTLRVALSDGRTLTAPAGAAVAFAEPPPGLAAALNGSDHTDPGELLRALDLPGHTARLAAEIDNSVANLALARAGVPQPVTLRQAAGDPDGLGRIEQQVVDGHPLHPGCRTRGAMSVADVLAYAPEHHPVIRLRRLRVPAARWHGDTEPVLYAHPWQAERLRDSYPWLTDDGQTGPVRPLMSLRTVAPLDGGAHVKTAVDVQMTSAVRTVSPAAVHNGPLLSALLRELTRDLPLDILAESGAGAVIVDGQPQRHLAHLRRAAPRLAGAEVAVPLAALATVAGETITDPYTWWEELAGVLVPPLLRVLERGVALEAHGQNTLVVLDAGHPVRILYRDFGGVRVSARRLRQAGTEPPPLTGDLPCDDPHVLRTKLAAALFGTVAAQLVALLERRHGADPARLWRIVAARSVGTADGRRMIRDPLPVKATTAMRLADDPLADIWARVANPMAVHG
ncbi:MAG: hypothetical protein QOH97_3825 [Actinoplanes sp.]|jgi:siderophore synthetase component|nr:hypothetical protein [Actinoplanes sp.]